MINYIKIPVPPIGANCYIVYDDITKNCLIIDLGGDFSGIMAKIKSLNLNAVGVILTHGHFDHVAGAVHCLDYGIPVYISAGDYQMLLSRDNMSHYFGLGELSFKADHVLSEGKTQIGGISLEVIYTPGHTKGSICLLIDGKLFSGDTLFALSYGRCDLPTGDFNSLKNSIINKLFTLHDDTEVLPGHGERTTIKHERKYNPINEDNY